jgi:zinc protease
MDRAIGGRLRAACWLLALGSLVSASASTAQAGTADSSSAPAWVQEQSDLQPDPVVRFGILPNGMRYALMHNAMPAGQVSMRLRIGSGSLQERDSQRGLAHFLEHMAFRGSRSVPDGEVKKSLERLGLQMGADTNAYTAQTQTVYKFDLARNDVESLDRGLLLMRETCDRLSLAAGTFATERGVVLSEWRLSDTPTQHLEDATLQFMLPGQLASRRQPIGTRQSLEAATVRSLRDYYRKWYRPERATFIVTGDIDVDAMEAKILARFGDWRAATSRPPEPDLGKPGTRRSDARVFIDGGVPSIVELHWVMPYDDSVDSHARERRDLIRQVGLAVLNRRLQVAAASADRKFSQAGVVHNAHARSADITTLYVGYDAGEWRSALIAAELLRRQTVEGGVQQAEVDREITAMRTQFRTAAAGAATRTTPRLADELVGSVDSEDVYTSPAQDVAESEAVFTGLTADAVNEQLRATFAANGPLALIASPASIADGDQRALAALNEAGHSAVSAAPEELAQSWPYTQFGLAGSVTDRRHIEDLDYTQLRFANGVRLNVKTTHYRAEQVLVQVNIAGGRAVMPTDRPSLDWASAAVVLGGTGKLDYQSLLRVLAGKDFHLNFAIEDQAISFSGETTSTDLPVQLQILAAYVSDAAFRPEAFEQVRSVELRQLTQLAATPVGVLQTEVPGLLRSGDARWAAPTEASVQAARADDLKGLIGSGLAVNPIEVTVVGDVTLEQAVDLVARTFGSLPARADKAAGELQGVRFPAGDATPVVLRHRGGADQGVSAIAWPTTDVFSDIRQSAVRQLLAEIVTARLFDSVRATAGAAYSPVARSQSSAVFRDYGYFAVLADVPPSKSTLFYDAIEHIALDLKANLVSADELDRARNPAVAKLIQARQTNTYWLGALSQTQSEPRFLELARQSLDHLNSVTSADIQAAANRYFDDAHAFRLSVEPERH